MGSDILREVVAVEAEITRNLDTEKKRAAEWIEGVRKEAEEEVLREKERLKESYASAIERARADSTREASTILEEAEARAGTLGGIDSSSFEEIIIKHIARILPGWHNDHKDV